MDAQDLFLSDDMIEMVARKFRLLGEPIRLRLLRLLQEREYSVNELTKAVHGNQSNVSRHLGALHEGGVLNRRREGSNIYYSISDPLVTELCHIVCDHAREQARSMLALLLPRRSQRRAPSGRALHAGNAARSTRRRRR